MSTITLEDFCLAVYCSYTLPQDLKPDSAGRLAFTALAQTDDREERFRVECEAVRDYSYRTEAHPFGPEDRVELSVVELEGEPGDWRVWFNPFYVHEIEFHCRRFFLNGAEVVGHGRHLQDDLVKRRPIVPPYPAGAA